MPNAHADGAGTRALSCHSHAWVTLSLSLSLIHPSLHPRPIPSMSLFWWCLGPGIAFAWAIVGGDAPVHHTKGKLHIKNSEQQASSMYASGGISRRAFKLWTCVFVTVYARMYFECAVRACVYTVYVLALLHNLHTLHCVASAAKGNKTMAGLPCNVELRRDAATTRLLEAASACSTQQR